MSSPLENVDSALVGGDVFLMLELARSFFIRPTLAADALIGGATGGYYATRLDACLRIPGNYTEHHGLLLDTCVGSELGAFDHTLAVPGAPAPVHATTSSGRSGPRSACAATWRATWRSK